MAILNPATFNEFPATNLLGYGLDFTTCTPMDIKSVLAAIKRARRIIVYYPDEDTRKLEVDGVIYDVPRCIGVDKYTISNGTYVTYSTGSSATKSLATNASLSASYMAVTASASLSYSIEKNYRKENQWALYSLNVDSYLASLRNYADLLAEGPLENRLSSMVAIGDGSSKKVVQDWKDFFASWGSHVIINSGYGARFQLNVWASNSDSSVNQQFSASVAAAFDGIATGGKFDASVTMETQYKTFSRLMQKNVSIMGGDFALANRLGMDPTHYNQYVDWVGSVAKNLSPMGLNVAELWVLMKEAGRASIREAAPMVMDAYNWIVQHPQPYRTEVTLDIQSDWAEFNLLSPSGVIIPNSNYPWPAQTIASNTRVQWGKEHSHVYERQTLRFFVINDGSPIDFSISHGSDGGRAGGGRAEVIMEITNYVNDKITDNVWNTVWFYSKSVSATPAIMKMAQTHAPHAWDDILRLYLEEIDALDWL